MTCPLVGQERVMVQLILTRTQNITPEIITHIKRLKDWQLVNTEYPLMLFTEWAILQMIIIYIQMVIISICIMIWTIAIVLKPEHI